MPDGISLCSVDSKTYFLTANEGDAREWGEGETAYNNEIKATLTAFDGSTASKI